MQPAAASRAAVVEVGLAGGAHRLVLGVLRGEQPLARTLSRELVLQILRPLHQLCPRVAVWRARCTVDDGLHTTFSRRAVRARRHPGVGGRVPHDGRGRRPLRRSIERHLALQPVLVVVPV
eukprot:2157632-Prymnesium_polylepis.1